jgi:hypothetical protein
VVFDLTELVTISKLDTGNRYQSIQVITEDQYTNVVVHDPGEYTLTQDEIGTRYAGVQFRTFKSPNRDQHSLEQRRDARQTLGPGVAVAGTSLRTLLYTYGDVNEVHPVNFLIGIAVEWHGLSAYENLYLSVVPDQNDGKTTCVLTVKNVPVGVFWDVSVYNSSAMCRHDDEVNVLLIRIVEDIVMRVSSTNSTCRFNSPFFRFFYNGVCGLFPRFSSLSMKLSKPENPSPTPDTDAGWSTITRTWSVAPCTSARLSAISTAGLAASLPSVGRSI